MIYWALAALGAAAALSRPRVNPYAAQAHTRACALQAGQPVTDDLIPERDRLVAWYLAHPDQLDCRKH